VSESACAGSQPLLERLRHGPMLGDDLARDCHLTVAELSTMLLMLEMEGRIKRLPGNQFALATPASS
jgi:predicted Rossmann fold nucleotide-binding protein DprA/Smf involved in DNA uptake